MFVKVVIYKLKSWKKLVGWVKISCFTEKNVKNIGAQKITEKLWENMISQTKKAGQMFRDNIPAWDDISIGVINSPPLKYDGDK